MSVYGIISEFNPFHNGHKYLFQRAKEAGADSIVCVMSGNSTQRGELALLGKYTRAEMALSQGADLVVELPYPYSSGTAESFARAGVAIAATLADTVFFGSESGNIASLTEAAVVCNSKEFIDEYKDALQMGAGTASIYFDLLEKKTQRKYKSNDILGIEYIKAAMRLGAKMSFATTKREGAGYTSLEIEDGIYQSATSLRQMIFEGNTDKIKEYIPEECFDILCKALKEGAVFDSAKFNTIMKAFFRLNDASTLFEYAENDMGIASRICKSAWMCGEEELLSLVKTKRYTDARLRRAMLFALTGVRKEDIVRLPSYVNLLGANENGRKLLAQNRKKGGLLILSKATDIPNAPEAQRQAELSANLDAVFSASLRKEISPSDMLRMSPIIY